MFQTPLGGISLITNLVILLIGGVINLVKGNPLYTAIISQQHILKLEETKAGALITMLLSYVIPFSIFTLVGGLSATTLYNLYHDTRRVTAVSLFTEGVRFGASQYALMLGDKVAAQASSTTQQKHFVHNTPTVLSESTNTPELYSVDFFLAVDEAFNRAVKHLVDNGPDASTTFILFTKARSEQKLVPFLEKNGLSTSLESRKTMALFFGIEAYNGTERQNNLLRKKLGDLTSNQLTQMSKTIIKQ